MINNSQVVKKHKKGTILVTDSLFIFDEHIKKLNNAGYEVERLNKPNASSKELKDALKGKVGYILGGIEHITDDVLENSDSLRAIALTLVDFKYFVPGIKTAKEKGIAITNTPGANSSSVSEFAIALCLMMQRDLVALGRTGTEKFKTSNSISGSTVGVVGVGNIGSKIIEQISAFSPKTTLYYSRTKKDCGAEYAELNKLIQLSDIIFIAVPKSAGLILGVKELDKIKKGALIVSMSPTNVIDLNYAYSKLESGDVRIAIDWPAPSKKFLDLPLSAWFNTNDHTGYNTYQANKNASDMAVNSILNILDIGEDKYRVV